MRESARILVNKDIKFLRPKPKDTERRLGCIAFAPDSKQIAGGCDGWVHLLETSGKELAVIDLGERRQTNCLSYSPDGSLLAVGGGFLYHEKSKDPTNPMLPMSRGSFKIVDTGFCEVKIDLTKHYNDKFISGLCFSPDGKYVAVGDLRGGLTLWNPEGERENFTQTKAIGAIAFTLDGSYLAVAVSNGWKSPVMSGSPTKEEIKGIANDMCRTIRDEIIFYSMPSLKEAFSIPSPHSWSCTRSIAFSPNSKKMATGGPDRPVALYDISSPTKVSFCVSKFPSWSNSNSRYFWHHGVTFTKNSEFIVAAGGHGATLWDAVTGEALVEFESHYRTSCVSISPDGKLLAVGGDGWDLIKGEVQPPSPFTIALWDLDLVQKVARVLHDK